MNGPRMNGFFSRLSLFLRQHTPQRIKLFLRLLRLVTVPPPPPAPAIPQAQLDGCQLLSSRNDMLDLLPKGGRVIELGTWRGNFAKLILSKNQPRELHLIDISFRELAPDVRAASNVTLHEDLTTEALARFDNESMDWIYIDADHYYDSVVKDIEAAAPKVKPGGYLVFNDFGRIVRPGLSVFGVHQAVCEFAVRSGWQVAFFCMQEEALYDIALRKPH